VGLGRIGGTSLGRIILEDRSILIKRRKLKPCDTEQQVSGSYSLQSLPLADLSHHFRTF